jgi:hypothetical protein
VGDTGGKIAEGVAQEDREEAIEVGEFEETSFDFPVVLLDVDDTMPPFRGAVDS